MPDPDRVARTRECSAALRKPFDEIVNSALRVGLDPLQHPPIAKPYKTTPTPMGLRPGLSYDSASELLVPEKE